MAITKTPFFWMLLATFKMSKIVVYTAITAGKDTPRNDIKVFSEADYNKFVSPVMNAKIFKILPHIFLDYDISIWIDGHIYLKVPPEQLVNEWLRDADMALLGHYRGKDLYWEAKMINRTFVRRTPWVRDEVNAQMEHYEKLGMPERREVAMCSLIIRRNNPVVNQFNDAWWAEICRWSQRDQISFPVVRRQFPQMKVNIIPKANIKAHPYLIWSGHAHFNT